MSGFGTEKIKQEVSNYGTVMSMIEMSGAKLDSEYYAWDIETWSPKSLDNKPRAIKLNPNNARIIAIGYRNPETERILTHIAKKDVRVHPEEERRIIAKFYNNIFTTTTIGYNIFRYDIPTLFQRAYENKISVNLTQYRHIDPFWLIPFWLHNTKDGQRFLNRTDKPSIWGNFWNIEKYSQIFLRKEIRKEYSGSRIRSLYEHGKYDEIKEHLIGDVSVLEESVRGFHLGIWELLIPIAHMKIKNKQCRSGCPFMNWVPKSMKIAVPFCSLTGRKLHVIPTKELTPIEIISVDLPARDADFRALCIIS